MAKRISKRQILGNIRVEILQNICENAKCGYRYACISCPVNRVLLSIQETLTESGNQWLDPEVGPTKVECAHGI